MACLAPTKTPRMTPRMTHNGTQMAQNDIWMTRDGISTE